MNGFKPVGSLYFKSIHLNDNNGNIIEENRYKSDGSPDWKYTWKYDGNGNTIETNWYKPDGSLKGKDTYKYDYDKKLNWTKRIELKNNVPIYSTEREIEYF